MKRNQLTLLSTLSSLIFLFPIGSWQQSALADERLLPRLSFEKAVFDLGDVGQGTKNSCEFRFTNTGRGLLKIGKISRTCGCTVFQLDKKEYTPNEIIHSFWPAYKRPFLWPCGRRPVFATKFTLQANPAENTKLVTKQRKSA